MPVIVDAPDGTQVEFPDGISPEEMHRSIAEHLSKTQDGPSLSADNRSLFSRATRSLRESLSPLIGPTELQQLERGPMADSASAVDRSGLLPALHESFKAPSISIPQLDAGFDSPITRGILETLATTQPPETTAAEVNMAGGLASGMTSPYALLAVGAGPLVGAAGRAGIGAGFGLPMALNAGQAGTEAGRLSVEGTPQQAANALGQMATDIVLPAAITGGVAGDIRSNPLLPKSPTEGVPNAIPIRKPETPVVGETPRSGQEVGARVPASGQAADAQGGQVETQLPAQEPGTLESISKALDSTWEAGAHGQPMPTRGGLEKKAGRAFTDAEWSALQKNHSQGYEFGANEQGVMSPDQALKHAAGEIIDRFDKVKPGAGDALRSLLERQQQGETLTPEELKAVSDVAKMVRDRANAIIKYQAEQAGLTAPETKPAQEQGAISGDNTITKDTVPDRVMVQGATTSGGETEPAYVSISSKDNVRAGALKAWEAAGHDVSGLSNLPTGDYSYSEAVRLSKEGNVEANPNNYTPAIRPGEGTDPIIVRRTKPIVGKKGEIHNNILDRQGDAEAVFEAYRVTGEEGRGFVGPDGKTWVSKEDLGKKLGVKGQVDSQRLNDLQEAYKPATPAATPAEPATVEAAPIGAGPGALTAGTEGVRTGEGADTYGIAQRVREQRAAAGQVAEVPTGEGISAPDSVERGRQLVQEGRSPENTLDLFEKTKALSADDMAVVRAHGEQLALEARRTEEKFGTESPEYKAAKDKLSEWDRRSKPMQTEWHKMGMAQQGETDIDTGSFTGIQRAYEQDTGKEFTPGQKKVAKETAGKVRKATTEADAAQTALADHLDEQSDTTSTDAEKAAEKAAKKTIREFAIRRANEVTKTRVKESALDVARRKVQEDAAQKAEEAAQKVIREAAARRAKAATTDRVKESALESERRKVQEDADLRAEKAAHKTLREAAVRRAKAATEARVTDSAIDVERRKVQEQAIQRAEEAAQKVIRDAAIRRAKAAVENRVNPEKQVWAKVKDYLDSGELDFNEIRNRVASDLGMSVKKVTDLLTENKRTKYLADEVWKKQESLRRFQQQAKRWLKSTALPEYQRALAAIPRTLFALKVGFHGTVALGTHAPMVAFQPRFWSTYVRNFGKMYKMVGSPKYYEMQIQDLVRRKNYTTARRAGLVNDPSTYEDYNSPTVSQYFGRLSGMGNRGYAVLKILRQDMFDQHWNNLPKTLQFPEMAVQIANGVNHATGVVKGAAPKGANIALFAPRLEASRVMWLLGDPMIAADTFARWKTANAAEKYFAIQQVKEKAWVAGTLFGMLALNQGVLSATDSRQKINFTDPLHSDFLKFKAAGMTASYGNAMLTMARLPVRLYQIRSSDGGKLKNVVYPDEDTYSVLGEYARSQESPFASLATTMWLKGDWQNRPLPNSQRPVPKRLREQGVKPYTWSEFFTEQVLPIPFEEAAREVWKHGMGMSDEQLASMRKAMATIAVMSATGARLVEDVSVNRPPYTPYVPKP